MSVLCGVYGFCVVCVSWVLSCVLCVARRSCSCDVLLFSLRTLDCPCKFLFQFGCSLCFCCVMWWWWFVCMCVMCGGGCWCDVLQMYSVVCCELDVLCCV